MGNTTMLTGLLLASRNRRRNAKRLEIHSRSGIAESGYIPIGGIEQWVTIRSEDLKHPIVLLIHGGPASAYTIFSPLLRSWERDFTVVQWDQRGAGKTYTRNQKEGSGEITFDRLAQDGIELAEYLCTRLGQSKVILLASSAGSLTGLLMARQRPELFHAYVGTDQNAPDPEQLAYRLTLEALRAAGHSKGEKLVERMGPDPSRWNRKDFERRNQYVVQASKDAPNMIMDLVLPSMLSSPEHTFRDWVDYFHGMKFSLDHLFPELVGFDFRRVGKRFEVPFFIFHGDKDILTPTVTARAFFDQVEAPLKKFVLIRGAGHLACFARPEPFLEELTRWVRPLAVPDEIR